MTPSKQFYTLFNIGAKWTGAAGVAQAQHGLNQVAGTAQRVHVRIKGMFKAIASYDILSRAVGAAVRGMGAIGRAAYDAEVAQDDLRKSVERTAKFYTQTWTMSSAEVQKFIQENTQHLVGLAEQMSKTGHDAEVLEAGFAKIVGSKALQFKGMVDMRSIFSDTVSYMYGAAATQEQGAEAGEMWSDFILQGNNALLKRIDASQAELLMNRQITVELRKGNISFEEAMKRRLKLLEDRGREIAGETERAFETPIGKLAQMRNRVEDIYEKLGEPFIRRLGAISDSVTAIVSASDPITTLLADTIDRRLVQLDEKLKWFSGWLKENSPQVVGFLKEVFYWLEKIQDAFDKRLEIFKWITPFGQQWQWAERLGLLKEPEKANKQAAIDTLREAGALPERYNPPIPKATLPPPFAYEEGYPTAMPPKVGAAAEKATTTFSAPAATPPAVVQQAAPATTPAKVDATVARQVLAEAQNTRIPATIRHRNPGGMYPGEAARKFGTIGTSTIGGGHKIATFPTAVHGAAANMWNLANKGYIGKTVGSVMEKWSGGYRGVPGPAGEYAANMRITQAMLNDPEFMIPFMQAIASGEAPGGHKVLSKAQWQQAFDWYQKGAPQAPKESLDRTASEIVPKAATGGATTQNINMNSPITVNGVAAGKEYAVGRTVKSAIQDPMRELLDRIKAARNYEARLGYV